DAMPSSAARGSTTPGANDAPKPRTALDSANSSVAGQVSPVAQYRWNRTSTAKIAAIKTAGRGVGLRFGRVAGAASRVIVMPRGGSEGAKGSIPSPAPA